MEREEREREAEATSPRRKQFVMMFNKALNLTRELRGSSSSEAL
jgi:hypothetical protein